jgi:hypothetical protein
MVTLKWKCEMLAFIEGGIKVKKRKGKGRKGD